MKKLLEENEFSTQIVNDATARPPEFHQYISRNSSSKEIRLRTALFASTEAQYNALLP